MHVERFSEGWGGSMIESSPIFIKALVRSLSCAAAAKPAVGSLHNQE